MKTTITRGQRFKDSPTHRHATKYTGADVLELLALPATDNLAAIESTCWRILDRVGIKPGVMLVKGPAKSAKDLEWRKLTKAETAIESKASAAMEGVNGAALTKAQQASVTRSGEQQLRLARDGWRHRVHPEGLATLTDELIPIDSTEGYACRILHHVGQVKHWKAEGDIGNAIGEALIAGNLYGEFRMAEWHSGTKSKNAKSKNEQMRLNAIAIAAETWRLHPATLIGEVVDNIRQRGCRKTAATIRGWLIDAAKRGDLSIPESARKPGRPHKKPLCC